MKKNDERFAYFKNNQAYKRIFNAMLKQWKIYGRCAGTIKIMKASDEEKEAVSSIIGKSYYGKDLSFKFSDFEDALQNTIFSGVQMQELLEEYFGYTIITNKDVERLKNLEYMNFFNELREELVGQLVDANQALTYTVRIQEDKDSVYSLLIREYKKNHQEAIAMLKNAWLAVERLTTIQRIRLAVLATDVCKKPHYFDRNLASGKCLLHVLSYVNKTGYPQNAEEIANLYYVFHILPDDISNFTTAYGIHLYCEKGIHQAYERFIEQREPYLIALSNLSTIISANSSTKHVYMVENQMLFSQLCEEMSGYNVAIVCTSGQLKLASLVLIELLCESNCMIYYAGDFDPEGILIAERVIARNPELIFPWHYRFQDYEMAISEEEISEERLKQLRHVKNEELQIIAKRMLVEKRTGFQEVLLADMLKDMKEHCGMKHVVDRAM